MKKTIVKMIKSAPAAGNIIILPYRFTIAMKHLNSPLKEVVKWLFNSKETTNFTYDLTDANEKYMASMISDVLGRSFEEIYGYVMELKNDKQLESHIFNMTLASDSRIIADLKPRYGRRAGWYAFVRATKPKVVIETGIDKGLGSCVLTAALKKNSSEGNEGFYYGTDINPKAGYLLSGDYAKFGKILYGDSIESLKKLNGKIDLFINDSDHSAAYEGEEYRIVEPKLNPGAIILGDNSHCTDELFRFALETGRHFIYFQETPVNHWYSGAGIGMAFKRK